jgi:hypothetical protein
MVERNLSDPSSMVGVTRAQLLAMKPPGWLERPLPPPHTSFRLLAPGKLPGAAGAITSLDAIPEWREYPDREPLPMWLLNETLESPVLPALAVDCSPERDGRIDPLHIREVAGATWGLISAGLVQVWKDSLRGIELELLPKSQSLYAVLDWGNWVRDENDPDVPSAASIPMLDPTKRGRRVLRSRDPVRELAYVLDRTAR